MSGLDIHNAVPREFKPRWGQLSLKFDGTDNNVAHTAAQQLQPVPALCTVAFFSPKHTAYIIKFMCQSINLNKGHSNE